ncbi:MAG: type III-B CRISPR module RAMP protein Cmr4 [Lentisphaeria bacterium]|nr:type III-B CRISPR module RAMP protein Cmr4 [Lentisphaeria bacterium]
METRILTLFTRTPLHVGAGNSVGAVDAPILRERHTRFPIISGSSLKGVLADLWADDANLERTDKGDHVRKPDGDASWLFGAEDAKHAGALLVGEARLLAFPVRSAKGCFAWIMCPTILRRAVRDGVLKGIAVETVPDVADDRALWQDGAVVAHHEEVMLEEYVVGRENALPAQIADAFAALPVDDPVWTGAASRLVLVSDGMMGFFCSAACEVAQHVRINDATGTASEGGLFNQENVPAETLFYAVLCAHNGWGRFSTGEQHRAADALGALGDRLASRQHLLQIGGDETTGLGWCSVTLAEVK